MKFPLNIADQSDPYQIKDAFYNSRQNNNHANHSKSSKKMNKNRLTTTIAATYSSNSGGKAIHNSYMGEVVFEKNSILFKKKPTKEKSLG